VIAGTCALVVLGGLTTGCGADGAPDGQADRTVTGPAPAEGFTPTAPADGVALGMYYGDRSLEATDAALGTTPAIHLTYVDWASDWANDPVLAADAARGQTSLVNWEPFGADFHDIVAGAYDTQITAQARAAAALERPVLLDFAAEMNEEEGWGGHDPELYVAAYQHIHDLFAPHDRGTVQWVWAPNNTDSDEAPPAIEYYPGDDYVDWTGMDGYNWGTSDPDFEWQSFADVFRDTYAVLHEIGKPVIIAETASAEEGGDKSRWIAGIAPTLRSDFPDVKALVWFDVDKERDWRIRSTEATEVAFAELAGDLRGTATE
jgi:hypothetical protein